MASGDLVSGLQLAFHGDEDLDHFHHARRQVVATPNLFDLVLEAVVESGLLGIELRVQRLDGLRDPFVADGQLPPLATRQLRKQVLGDLRLGLHALGALGRNLAKDHFLEARVGVALENRELVVPVAGKPLDFFALDLQCPLVLFDSVAVEDPDFDDGPEIAGGQPQ